MREEIDIGKEPNKEIKDDLILLSSYLVITTDEYKIQRVER